MFNIIIWIATFIRKELGKLSDFSIENEIFPDFSGHFYFLFKKIKSKFPLWKNVNYTIRGKSKFFLNILLSILIPNS